MSRSSRLNKLAALFCLFSFSGGLHGTQGRVLSRHFRKRSILSHNPNALNPRAFNQETKRSKGIAITGARDFSYYTTVNVGGQPFNVALDTGSADLWIQSQNCSDHSDCSQAPQYTPSSSLLRSVVPFTINYLSGKVSGLVATDTIRFAGYEILDQVFALAEDLQNVTFAQMGISGMLGLGFPPIAAITPNLGLPVIFNIAASLPVGSQFFSFRLGRAEGSDPGNSSFNIGEHDPIVKDSSALQYIPVYPNDIASNAYDFWKLPLDAIVVNGKPLPLAKSKVASSKTPIAVFDTGTSLILGPTTDVDAFYQSLDAGNPTKENSGSWTVDCSLAISALMIFGGHPYPIHPLDLSWDKISDGQGRCYGGLQGNNGVASGDYLFGDTAMRNMYTAHYFQTARTPPLIGLLSTTLPSASLREFMDIRGPDYILSSGASFSDDVLTQSFTSAYPAALALQNSLSRDNWTIGNTNNSMPYYTAPNTDMDKASREFVLVILIATGTVMLGGIAGTLITRAMKRGLSSLSKQELDALSMDDQYADSDPLIERRYGGGKMPRQELITPLTKSNGWTRMGGRRVRQNRREGRGEKLTWNE
ncbi:acid protease [Clavulina sp. PMI_390]|nr:acid protease [Clavulina sp. PMI_390]